MKRILFMPKNDVILQDITVVLDFNIFWVLVNNKKNYKIVESYE